MVGQILSFGKGRKVGGGLSIIGGLLGIGASVPFFFYKNFLNLEALSIDAAIVKVNVEAVMGAGIIAVIICGIAGGLVSTVAGCMELGD